MAVFLVLVAMLPIGMTGLRQLQDMVLCQRARQYLEQTLPAAFIRLDPVALSYGQPKYIYSDVNSLLRTRFAARLPASLRGRLILDGLEFREQRIQPDSGHWMGSSQQGDLPSITIRAHFVSHQGLNIPLEFSIEFLVD